MIKEKTIPEQLREIADRLDDGWGDMDFGDKMLRQTIQNTAQTVLYEYYATLITPASIDDGARRLSEEICILLNALMENKTEPRRLTEEDFNDPRITSGRGDGKP